MTSDGIKSMEDLLNYVKERDEAVKTMDTEVMKAFIRKYSPECFEMPEDYVLEVTMRKMAVHSTNLDVNTRVEAFRWLLERGFDFSLE